MDAKKVAKQKLGKLKKKNIFFYRTKSVKMLLEE